MNEIAPAVPWLNVAGAATYLATTKDAIRGLVKRGRLPVHRTETGRLLFRPEELDDWVLAGEQR
jgi:excisionase family DNA binding protein